MMPPLGPPEGGPPWKPPEEEEAPEGAPALPLAAPVVPDSVTSTVFWNAFPLSSLYWTRSGTVLAPGAVKVSSNEAKSSAASDPTT